MNNDIVVFFNSTLDGCGSYLVIKWFHPGQNIIMIPVTYKNFEERFVKYFSFTKAYKKLYIINMDISKYINIIKMYNNVYILNHYKDHIDNINKLILPNIKKMYSEYSSSTKLSYKILSKLHPETLLKPTQKALVSLVDDFEAQTNKDTRSKQLNDLFWSLSEYRDKKCEVFISWFIDGFTVFNNIHKAFIANYYEEVNDILKNINLFKGVIKIKKQPRTVISAIVEKSYPAIIDFIIENKNVDIGILVNTKTNKVLFKRNEKTASDIDLSKIAETFCEGYGHPFFAGGSITPMFLELTKMFEFQKPDTDK